MAKIITKAELIEEISKSSCESKADVSVVLDAITATISAQLVAGNAVTLPGLAKFETRERPARKVRNPATGEMLDRNADRAIKVTGLKALKVAVNN